MNLNDVPRLSPEDIARMMGRTTVKYDFVDREWIGKPDIMIEHYTEGEWRSLRNQTPTGSDQNHLPYPF